MSFRHWQCLATPDFSRLDPERTVVLLPLSAVEQHGPHLPLGTDALINAGLVAALAGRALRADVLVLPGQVIGHSLEHLGFPGTLSLAAEVLLEAWTALAQSVAAAGLRKIVLLNTHGGNNALVHVAALRMRAEHSLLAVRANYSAFGSPAGLFKVEELRDGLHGGEMETSLMLHLHPELVRTGELAEFTALTHRMSASNRLLGPEKPVGFGWLSGDLSQSGASGNAAAADADRGGRLLVHLADQLATLIDEVAATPLSTLRPT
jgi:creatinine amidohydrolase